MFEELQGFGSVVPETFENVVDEKWGPLEGGV